MWLLMMEKEFLRLNFMFSPSNRNHGRQSIFLVLTVFQTNVSVPSPASDEADDSKSVSPANCKGNPAANSRTDFGPLYNFSQRKRLKAEETQKR